MRRGWVGPQMARRRARRPAAPCVETVLAGADDRGLGVRRAGAARMQAELPQRALAGVVAVAQRAAHLDVRDALHLSRRGLLVVDVDQVELELGAAGSVLV